MIKNIKAILVLYTMLTLPSAAFAQAKPYIFGNGLSPNDPAFDNTPVVITEEDLADPPPGEIRKLYLSDVNQLRSALSANLAAAPEGPDGQQSPWMAKFQSLKAGMDQIAVSRSQRHVIDLIPKMKEVFEAGGTAGYSDFFAAQGGLLRSLGVCVVNAIAEHVTDQGANVAPADLANFVAVFSVSGFILAPDWEDQVMPIDAAGVMILDAAAVVTQLKALPWKQAELFLGRYSPVDAFEDYETAGGGLPALKAKYAANKAAIVAKWQELQTWVSHQRAVNP
jgi:hypothetical protein